MAIGQCVIVPVDGEDNVASPIHTGDGRVALYYLPPNYTKRHLEHGMLSMSQNFPQYNKWGVVELKSVITMTKRERNTWSITELRDGDVLPTGDMLL